MNKTLTIMLTALFTALLVGGGAWLLRGRQIAMLEQEVAALESANAQLQEQVDALREDPGTGTGENGDTGPQISLKPSPGWEEYFPTAETTTLLSEPPNRVRELLGEPPVLLRSIAANPVWNREIWIYMPFDEDPTGLYIYFKGDRVIGSRLDEFVGLFGSGLLDDEQFWLR